MAFNGSFWSFLIVITLVYLCCPDADGVMLTISLTLSSENQIFEKFPEFSDISFVEIVTHLHFFSYALFIVQYFIFRFRLSKFLNQNSWKFEIFYDLLCSRNDFSRVKINKWQGEACFELKRVEAPLAKSSIVPSFAFNPKQALFSLILTLFSFILLKNGISNF